MIELNLENLLKDYNYIDNDLYKYNNAIEKSADRKEMISVEQCWNKMVDVFGNLTMTKLYNPKHLRQDLNMWLKPGLMIAAYYFGQDYMYRKNGREEHYGVKYLNRFLKDLDIPGKKSRNGDDEGCHMRVVSLFKEQEDYAQKQIYNILENHFGGKWTNPWFAKNDLNCFCPNVQNYLDKMYSGISCEKGWKYFHNYLTSLTPILFDSLHCLSYHKNTDGCSWSIERIRELDRNIKLYMQRPYVEEGDSKSIVYSEHKISDNRINRILLEWAAEDLFGLNRMSLAFQLCNDFLRLNLFDDTEKDRKDLMDFILCKTICSLPLPIENLPKWHKSSLLSWRSGMHANLPLEHEDLKDLVELFAIPVVYQQALIIFLRYLYGDREGEYEDNIKKHRSELRDYILSYSYKPKPEFVKEHVWDRDALTFEDKSSPFMLHIKNHGHGRTYQHIDFDRTITEFKAGNVSWLFQSELYNAFRPSIINENRARSGKNVYGQHVGNSQSFVKTEEVARKYFLNVCSLIDRASDNYLVDRNFFRKTDVRNWL